MRSAHPQGVGGASAGAGGLLKLTRSSQGRPVQRLARPAGRTGRGLGPLDGTPISNLDMGQCPGGALPLHSREWVELPRNLPVEPPEIVGFHRGHDRIFFSDDQRLDHFALRAATVAS